jgi:hypothetical protein
MDRPESWTASLAKPGEPVHGYRIATQGVLLRRIEKLSLR